jgi:hypothetical protein
MNWLDSMMSAAGKCAGCMTVILAAVLAVAAGLSAPLMAQMPPLPERRATDVPGAELAAPAPPPAWTEAEIINAQSICIRALAGASYDLELLPPIREGGCGTPAPIQLNAIPADPVIRLSPPATLTCGIAVKVRDWALRVMQPTAIARLGEPIVAISTAGSYVCRTRNHQPGARLSQHALAQAIDIREFLTASGQRISVLEHWDEDGERAAFLRDVHSGACQIFDTVLGPQADPFHRDHFHFDLGSGGVCQ